MNQSVVIEYVNLFGERWTFALEPLAVVWGTTERHTKPQWILWAWIIPSGEFHGFAMAGVREWTPIMGDDEEEAPS